MPAHDNARQRILISGAGGQGVILLGKILATASLPVFRHTTFFPDYSAEVRGGFSSCQIILAPDEIASPVASRFEAMILMNQPSVDRYLNDQTPGGLVLVNHSLCSTPARRRVVLIRASEEAERLGDVRAANFVMLGALLARRELVAPIVVERIIGETFRGKSRALLDLNLRAFQAGRKL